MQGTELPTFRPTVWPAEPPRTPAVERWTLREDPDSGGLSLWQPAGTVELPPDFVFQELLDLRPTSAADVIAITETWGLAAGSDAGTFTYLQGEPPAGVVADLEHWQAAGQRGLVHPEAVALHLQVLRALSRHRLASLEGQDEAAEVDAWGAEGMRKPRSVKQARGWWVDYMTRGLTPFSVFVEAPGITPLFRPVPNLFNASCLQLAQYSAGEGRVKRCANERCRKPFTRQRGRARDEYGQHWSRGVRYCSHLCAKAQSERDRRRRRASEAAEARGVDSAAAGTEHHDDSRDLHRGASTTSRSKP